MKHARVVGMVVALMVGSSLAMAGQATAPTADQVKKAIIKESIASYPGVCACPYNVTRNGSRCGGRSAYSKPGGYSPKRYPRDVTDQDIQAWRLRNNQSDRG